MPGLYTHTTRADGTTLTAAIYNADHQNHIDNLEPDKVDDSSANVTAMRAVADPGESGSESLATTLQGELRRIRNVLVEITGKTFWYETPAATLASITVVTADEDQFVLAGQVFGD